MATKQLRKSITTFSDFFKLAGLDENNFMVPENGTWAEKAAMQHTRLKVAQIVLNGDEDVNKADTTQGKCTPWLEIIPDESALGGFRLSYHVFGCADVYTNLGARPEFLDSDDADFLGTEFLNEIELLAQYQAMADAELIASLKQKKQ